MITKNQIPVSENHRLIMAAQIAWVNVLEKKANRKFYVRWPNDIWSEDGKVAAIVFFHEDVNLMKWIGVVLIMLGCFFIARS